MTKQPFDPKLGVAIGIHEKGKKPNHLALIRHIKCLGLEMPYAISVYPGSGTADGINGDHILLAPAYNVTAELIEDIVSRTARLVEDYFAGSEFR